MRGDTFWYILVCLDAIYHDWSNSDDTMCHDLVSRSDTITNVQTGLSQSDKVITTGVLYIVRTDTFGFVPIRSVFRGRK